MAKVRPDLFVYTVNQLYGGQFAEDVSEQLNECVERVVDTGLQAELTVKLKVCPNGRGGSVIIKAEHNQKLPKDVYGDTVMWPTPDHNLVIENPKQGKLFNEVGQATPKFDDIGEANSE